MATETEPHKRHLLTLAALADLGPLLAGERNFSEAADAMLRMVMEVTRVREGVLFRFDDKPAQLNAVAWRGLALFPQGGYIPLLARQVHALTHAAGPESVNGKGWDKYLSSTGNVAPELFKCIVPLRAMGKLAGAVALGPREGGEVIENGEAVALGTLSNYIALAVYNQNLSEQLQARVIENLKLIDSMHGFCDQTMEVFAAAIDAKEFRASGHSVRVGRYSSAIAAAMKFNSSELAEIRAAGYLHDIGKVMVDRRLFHKPAALEPGEFREMADHAVVGHRIISGVQLPWASISEVVRWHHERCDGTGYPDHLNKEQLPLPTRIVAVADTFDAMTHERPYREPMSVGQALTELVRNSPQKLDSDVVQALLTCVRGEASGRGQPFLDTQVTCNIAPADVDQLAADLKYRATKGRVYSA